MTTFFWTKYPFVRVGLSYILGIFVAYYFLELPDFTLTKNKLPILYCCITTIVLVGVYLLSLKKYIRSSIALLILFACIGFCRFIVEDPRIDKLHLEHIEIGTISKVIGTIHTEPTLKNKKQSYTISIQAVYSHNNWLKANGYVKVYSNLVQNIALGQAIIISSKVKHTSIPTNEYDFNFAQYLAFQKTYHVIYNYQPVSVLPINKQSIFLSIPQNAIMCRLYIEKVIKENISKPAYQNIITALLTGKRNDISKEDKDLFTNSGTIHILAISGMHIVIIYQLLIFIIRLLQVKSTALIPSIFILLFIWFYIFICGLHASTIRAGVMISILLIGNIFQKNTQTINSLFAAAFIMLLYNPYYIADIGFCLSFLAVIGICSVSEFTTRDKGIKSYFKNAMLISTGAQITTLPYSIFLFQQFPTYFLVANLIVVPAATLLLLSSIALLVFYQIPYLSAVLVYSITTICDFTFFVLQTLNQLPLHIITNISFTLLESLLLYTVIGSIILAFFIKSKQYIWLFTICSCLITFSLNSRIINAYRRPTTVIISGNGENRQYLLLKNTTAYLIKKESSIINSYPTKKYMAQNFTQNIINLPLPTQANFTIKLNQEHSFNIFRQKNNKDGLLKPKTGLNIIDYKNKYSYIKSTKKSRSDSQYMLETKTHYFKQL